MWLAFGTILLLIHVPTGFASKPGSSLVQNRCFTGGFMSHLCERHKNRWVSALFVWFSCEPWAQPG